MLHHLELSAVINWNTDVVWQARPVHPPTQLSLHSASQPEEWINVDHLAQQLEEGYCSGPKQAAFTSGFNTFQVDYENKRLVNNHTGGAFELRRLAFAPLMPLKVREERTMPCCFSWYIFSIQTEEDSFSLYHAASLGFWGIHDRTSLLSEAVSFTLSDIKAQFLLYDRWSQQTASPTSAAAAKSVSACKVNLTVTPHIIVLLQRRVFS